MNIKKAQILFFFLPFLLHAVSDNSMIEKKNPFLVDVEEKEVLSDIDWEQVQEKLHQIDVANILDPIYPCYKKSWLSLFQKPALKEKEDFLARSSCGVRQILFTAEQKPIKKLIPIHGGGDCCIVSFASYNKTYAQSQQQIPQQLEKVGFRGY
ncbi:MAG: hypothetical protein FJZ58_08545, partial [Chlamydiae bacterium]|nr:hypothetical protein [Chlamydiota bacterium]